MPRLPKIIACTVTAVPIASAIAPPPEGQRVRIGKRSAYPLGMRGDRSGFHRSTTRAYDVAGQSGDPILMARARVVRPPWELARLEEQLGEEPNIGLHAHAAVTRAEAAITLAQQTQNKLAVRGIPARGLVAASEFFLHESSPKSSSAKPRAANP